MFVTIQSGRSDAAHQLRHVVQLRVVLRELRPQVERLLRKDPHDLGGFVIGGARDVAEDSRPQTEQVLGVVGRRTRHFLKSQISCIEPFCSEQYCE